MTESSGGAGGITTGLGSGASSGIERSVFDCTRSQPVEDYLYDANIPASRLPPGGLKIADTPLFVSLGFDDNSDASGVSWAAQMIANAGGRASFYYTSAYATEAGNSWKDAAALGMETGLHTESHPHGGELSTFGWSSEIAPNIKALLSLGIQQKSLFGFRAPYLEYNDAMFAEIRNQKLWYDCSIEEGFGDDEDGQNHHFPYTLDEQSPGHANSRDLGVPTRQFELGLHPGIFELPVYALIVPDDGFAKEYDFAPGLRARITAAGVSDFAHFGYKITGFDWNLWFAAQVNGAEFLAILKYNFDLRRAGNRAPFLFGAHTENYANNAERQQALASFVAYASSFPEVRVVQHKEVLDFMREPKALRCY